MSIVTQEFNWNIRVTEPHPVNANEVFSSLAEALSYIEGPNRFKGQRFVVTGEDGQKPIEYWFVKGYVAAGEDWVEDPDGVDPDDPNYPWRPDPPEFIPTLENGGLVLYQPGGGELPPLSGETIMASLDPNFPYKSFDKVVAECIFCETAVSYEAA